jgi:hypothetical protein
MLKADKLTVRLLEHRLRPDPPAVDTYDRKGGGTEGMSSNTVQPSGYATQGMPCAQRTAIVGVGRVGSAKQPPANPVWPGLHAPNDLQ